MPMGGMMPPGPGIPPLMPGMPPGMYEVLNNCFCNVSDSIPKFKILLHVERRLVNGWGVMPCSINTFTLILAERQAGI